jgi:Uri superfamily endonuclease
VKGSYLLLFRLPTDLRQIAIGRFGLFDFAPGYYLYVGSAMGSGGLEARLAYHRTRQKRRPHWHIDYLRPHMQLVETWAVASSLRLECDLCSHLAQLPTLSVPVRGFGTRDTGCSTHLFYSDRHPGLRPLTGVLLNSLPLHDGREHELKIDISTYDD